MMVFLLIALANHQNKAATNRSQSHFSLARAPGDLRYFHAAPSETNPWGGGPKKKEEPRQIEPNFRNRPTEFWKMS